MTTQEQTCGHAYKASHSSSRVSPFRRPEGIISPSPLRHSTPNPLIEKMYPTSTTHLSNGSNQVPEDTNSTESQFRNKTHAKKESLTLSSRDVSPCQQPDAFVSRNTMDRNAISKLQPSQIRELREAFQILDRDSDGYVSRDDVADILNQLGLSASPSEISSFFPHSTEQTATLPVYLNSIADLLSAISPPCELISAFSAFDEDDSGQIDLNELKNALKTGNLDPGESPLSEKEIDNAMAEFTGRRATRKQVGSNLRKTNMVFKYQDFIACVAGGISNDEKSEKNKEG